MSDDITPPVTRTPTGADVAEQRPSVIRHLSYDDLDRPVRAVARAEDIVPIELVEPGDVQVRVGSRRDHRHEPVDLDRLADFPSVRSVYALRPVRARRPLPNIEELLTSMLPPDGETLRNLPNLKRLHSARFIRSTATRLDPSALPASLEALNVARHSLAGGWDKKMPADGPPRFADLLHLTSLRRLTLRDCWPGDSVAPLAGLTSLVLLDCDAPNGWSKLGTLTALEAVTAVRPQVANLKALRTWTRLRSLTLGNAGVKSLAGIEAFHRLERLTLFLVRVGDLSPIAGLSRLAEIVMRGPTNVKDLTPLGQLPALRRLEIERVGIGARDDIHVRSIKPLASAAALEEVLLPGVSIDDGDVTPLIGLPRLRRVKVYGDLDASVLELRRARPDVTVDWRPADQRQGERMGDVYLQKPVEGSTQWWMSEDLTELLGTRTNHDAERRLVSRMRTENPALLAQLDFDTEGDAVVVLAKTRADLIAVAELIARMAKERASDS
jgi:hypothetical protein